MPILSQFVFNEYIGRNSESKEQRYEIKKEGISSVHSFFPNPTDRNKQTISEGKEDKSKQNPL
jgi:hypothetical protein